MTKDREASYQEKYHSLDAMFVWIISKSIHNFFCVRFLTCFYIFWLLYACLTDSNGVK